MDATESGSDGGGLRAKKRQSETSVWKATFSRMLVMTFINFTTDNKHGHQK